jgi:arabinogalactan endo-1,4-beta-galactosidase
LKNTIVCATFNLMKKAMLAVLLTLLLAQTAPADEVKAMLGIHTSKYLFSSNKQGCPSAWAMRSRSTRR